MSLLDKASLILTPNAYKASKLYSVIPSNGNGDMTVVRATTATRVNSTGLVENVAINVPRLNYDTVGSCPSILLEPQRTNLSLRSEEFDNGYWTKRANITVTANDAISPNNTLSADKLINSGSTSNIQGTFANILTTNGTFTFSVYAKSGTVNKIRLAIRNASSDTVKISQDFTLTNQWVRYVITGTTDGATTGIRAEISTDNVLGNILIWGAQVEAGAYATSYIPTVTSTVTRNIDGINKTGIASLIGQTEGVLFFESAALFNELINRIVSISDNTSNNRIVINYSVVSNQIQLSVTSGAVQIVVISYTIGDETQFAKIAVRYSNTLGYSLWVNGINRGSSVVTTMPASMSRLAFDNGSNFSSFFYGKIKSLQLYKTYLNDQEMIALTTL